MKTKILQTFPLVKKRESYMAIRVYIVIHFFLTSMQHVRNYLKPYIVLKQNDIF